MYFVASFTAKGIMPTSHSAKQAGSSSYERGPNHAMLGRFGSSAGSILTTGPIISNRHSGFSIAESRSNSASSRSSMTAKKPTRSVEDGPRSRMRSARSRLASLKWAKSILEG